jgi:hypothetical protein
LRRTEAPRLGSAWAAASAWPRSAAWRIQMVEVDKSEKGRKQSHERDMD